MKQLLYIALIFIIFIGCKNTAPQISESDIKLELQSRDTLFTISNGGIYPIDNGKTKFTFAMPGDSIALKINLSYSPGTSILLSRGVHFENIRSLKSGSGLAASREDSYPEMPIYGYGSFYFVDERFDTLYQRDSLTIGEITSELQFDRDSIVYVTALLSSGEYLTAIFHHPQKEEPSKEIEKQFKECDSIYSKLLQPVTDSLGFSFQIDAQTTENGMIATLSASREDTVLDYRRYEYVADTIMPHETYEYGTASTFNFTGLPALDTVTFKLRAYGKYTTYHQVRGTAEEILQEVKQISQCGWIPGKRFVVKRGDEYYMLEYDCQK